MNPAVDAVGISGLVIWAAYTDFRYRMIPNRLTVGGAAVGLLWHGISQGIHGFLSSLAGLAVGFALMFVLYLLGALGAGDVKLFASIGAIGGLEFVFYSSIYAILFAGFIGLVMVLFRKGKIYELFCVLLNLIWFRSLKPIRELRTRNDLMTFPFMAAVVPAIALAAFEYWM